MSDEPKLSGLDESTGEFHLRKRSEADAVLHLSENIKELKDFIDSLKIQPDKMTVKCNNLEITGIGIRAEIKLDGVTVPRVVGYSLQHQVQDVPRLSLTVLAI